MRRLLFISLILAVWFAMTASVYAQAEIPDDYPEIRTEVNGETAPGHIYIANFRRSDADPDGVGNYVSVVDNDGTPLFVREAGGMRAYNFGRAMTGELHYFELTGLPFGGGAASRGVYHIIDETGASVHDFVIPRRGYPTQLHTFYMLENGNAIISSQPPTVMDLRPYGGHERALGIPSVIMEVDREGNILFEWHTLDHFDFEEIVEQERLTAEPPDGVHLHHVNALTLDNDGNIVISLRRLDQVVGVSRETGEMLWRMGGVGATKNDFTIIDDPDGGFSGQHRPSILPNGNLLLFDNGTFKEDRVSRVVEYELDLEEMTATMVWEYRDAQERYAPTMGSAQRLENGNTLIGWGSASPDGPSISEVTPDGEVVFELYLPETQINFAAYRHPFGEE